MRVAVITPYHTEPVEMLRRAHESVASQTHPCTHYMVADGHARPEIDSWEARHIGLPVSHNNNGNTPRAVGSLDAIGDGFDAIAYLDADNWFEPDHIEGLVIRHQETGADIVSSGRVIHGLDGTVLLPEGESEDGTSHADTSTIIVFESAFQLAPVWSLMPKEMAPNCDRVFFGYAKRLRLRHDHTGSPTLHFTSRYGPHYRRAGVAVPAEATAMFGIKESEAFIREFEFLGCDNFLNASQVRAIRTKRAERPVTIIVLAEEGHLTAAERSLFDDLELQDPEVEIFFSDPKTLESDTKTTLKRRHVFVFVLETDNAENETLCELVDRRPDLKFIFLRTPVLPAEGFFDTGLDRRAWRIFVFNDSLKAAYHQGCRFGGDHVLVSSPETLNQDVAQLVFSSIGDVNARPNRLPT